MVWAARFRFRRRLMDSCRSVPTRYLTRRQWSRRVFEFAFEHEAVGIALRRRVSLFDAALKVDVGEVFVQQLM